MPKLSVRDLELTGKRVLLRVDYNVPMEEKNGAMVINDTTRIKETLPTLELLRAKGARVVLDAHLGRQRAAEALGRDRGEGLVRALEDALGADVDP